jgi:pimeloyl-ACP methyl ester carboxylesterase
VLDSAISLSDGRQLAFAEYGSSDGLPVMYFHGSPSSRLEPLLLGESLLRRSNLRLVSADRPGIGGSDPLPGRGFASWAQDVAALADHLGWDRFSLLGNSGGGPYVAACAALIPDRIAGAVIVSGGWRMDWPEALDHLPFMNRMVMILARRAPLALRALFRLMAATSGKDPEQELAQMKGRMPPPDYEAFSEPGRMQALGDAIRECMRQGARGAVWEMGMYTRAFDFEASAIRLPIQMFHGTADANAPIQLARRVASIMPAATLQELQGEAHLSTLCNHWDEIARALHEPGWHL